jgi:hypothetical protein
MRFMCVAMIAAVAVIACGCASKNEPPKRGAMSNAVSVLRGKTPIEAVRMMEDQSSADRRREGIYRLVQYDFGQSETYCRRYRQIAVADKDFTVRAAAVRALNWSRDRNAVPVFITALGDQSEMVRWQAAKALVNIPDASAAEALTRAVGNVNETINVRLAAVDALHHYRDAGAARALANLIGSKDFGIAWQARRSLRAMTGADYRYDERAWLEHLTRS